MNKPAIFDGRNILNSLKMKKIGFIYKGIGKITMKVKTVLVTVGGFIGSHLCHKRYQKIEDSLDDLSTGSKQNISNLINHKNFEFVKHDINQPYFRQGIDEIYNLACPASPIQYQKNPIKTIKTCTIGVINILGLAKANKAKVLQASTSEVYILSIHKRNYFGNVNTTGPRSCYDEVRDVQKLYLWIITESTN